MEHFAAIDQADRPFQAILLTSVKNEAPFLLEWVSFHRAIGFDRILVAFNDCDDGTEEMLHALQRIGWLEALPNPVSTSVAPQAAAARIFSEVGEISVGDWVLWLDLDEFLNVHVGDRMLGDLIDRLGNHDAALINWRVFGDGNGLYGSAMLADPFVRAASPESDLNSTVKTLFRHGPHIHRFDIHRPVLAIEGAGKDLTVLAGSGQLARFSRRINRAWLAGRGSRITSRCHVEEAGWELAQINHYAVRDRQFFQRKMRRGRGYKAAGVGNNRHGDDYWTKFNLNDVEDRSILSLAAMTRTVMQEAMQNDDVRHAAAFIEHRLGETWNEMSGIDETLAVPSEPSSETKN